jgi:hypothetical protein
MSFLTTRGCSVHFIGQPRPPFSPSLPVTPLHDNAASFLVSLAGYSSLQYQRDQEFTIHGRPRINRFWRTIIMQPAKQEALDTIDKLPDDTDMDEIMYRLYVLDKIRKGQEAVDKGRTATSEELRREIDSW